ncbi:coiled-coil domain-containing protein 66-like isoform X2 [Scyliorhinus torazame]
MNSPDTASECYTVPNTKELRKKPSEKIVVNEKENVLLSDDSYNQFARTKKGKNEKRPEWNANKTSKRYVPASERYPKGLQREREEKKMKRQMELLQLLEKSVPELRAKKRQPSKELPAERQPSPVVPARQAKIAVGVLPQPAEKQGLSVLHQDDPAPRSNSNSRLPADKCFRSASPPVPALRNKHLQMEQKDLQTVPNINADEIYHLDPDAPMSRPSTNDPQYKNCNVTDHLQHQSYSSDHPRDPLLNPDLVRNRERQQAILKGLSELRQGLMQKQRELETGLTSNPVHQSEQYLVPSQHL